MTEQKQKGFGEFVKERFGANWVYAARDTPNLHARYDKPDCPVKVITPKQQRQLAADYKSAWGREHDSEYWAAVCALRALAVSSGVAREALAQMGLLLTIRN